MSSDQNRDKQESDFMPHEIHNIMGAAHLMGMNEDDEFMQEVRQHIKENQAHEANYKKMRAAQHGENPDLGPGDFENQQVKQGQALRQQAATQGAQQAQSAQAAQMPVNAPRQTGGAEGVNVPYPPQKRPQQPPGPDE